MRIHHLNCGWMCLVGGALFGGFSQGLTARLVYHCLLIETNQGLVMIATVWLRDVQLPYSQLSPSFVYFDNAQFDRKYITIAQIEALGFSTNKVLAIIFNVSDRVFSIKSKQDRCNQ